MNLNPLIKQEQIIHVYTNGKKETLSLVFGPEDILKFREEQDLMKALEERQHL